MFQLSLKNLTRRKRNSYSAICIKQRARSMAALDWATTWHQNHALQSHGIIFPPDSLQIGCHRVARVALPGAVKVRCAGLGVARDNVENLIIVPLGGRG